MENNENQEERCCKDPKIQEVTGDLEGHVVIGTVCSNCGASKGNSTEN